MVSPRHKNVKLWVLATAESNVREIDELGKPLVAMRFIGKESGAVVPYGVEVPYHSHYIAMLMEKSLLPMDAKTAALAGISWNPILTPKLPKTEAPVIESKGK